MTDINDLILRDAPCHNAMHDYPLSRAFLHASDMADTRLENGWENSACPDCGVFGWVPPGGHFIRYDRDKLIRQTSDGATN